ncbi:hypothetical protein Salat_2134100 [Sesamum alatum]|uniref:Integrase zinc-binding domain-containing protein n=1 Tax=Sesamum alatum TaxID=300844 RepID=A0AAE2CH35_9LAMI|nr:hypothetical protein Salat_2134100 [Sesamum alatum]
MGPRHVQPIDQKTGTTTVAIQTLGCDYEIFYKPGKWNIVADALSRVPIDAQLLALAASNPSSDLVARLRTFYSTHPVGSKLLKRAQAADGIYSEQVGLVLVNHRLFIPPEANIRTQLLQEFHSTSLGLHSGVRATLSRLAETFYWQTCEKMLRTSSANAPPINNLSTPPRFPMVFCSCCLYRRVFGRRFLWISSHIFPRPMAKQPFGWLWTASPNFPIS